MYGISLSEVFDVDCCRLGSFVRYVGFSLIGIWEADLGVHGAVGMMGGS